MSVIAGNTCSIDLYIPAPGLDSPWPVGQWRSSLEVNGDATGGYFNGYFTPPNADQARKYLWSWEEASCRIDSNLVAAIAVILRLITAEFYPGFNEYYSKAFMMAPVAVIGETAMQATHSTGFKKIHRPVAGLTQSYNLFVDGNLNGVTYRMAAWGYLWHPQARTLASGPRRP